MHSVQILQYTAVSIQPMLTIIRTPSPVRMIVSLCTVHIDTTASTIDVFLTRRTMVDSIDMNVTITAHTTLPIITM
jgi:hypothetical protein